MQSFFHWGPDLYRPPSTHPTTRPPIASTSCQLRTRVEEGVSRHPLSYQRAGYGLGTRTREAPDKGTPVFFSSNGDADYRF